MTVTIRPKPPILCRLSLRKPGRKTLQDDRKARDDRLGRRNCRNPDLGLGTSLFPTSSPDIPDSGSQGPLSRTSPSVPFPGPQELIPFTLVYIKDTEGRSFPISLPFSSTAPFPRHSLYSLSIFRSPLGGPHVITLDVTNITSDPMTRSPNKETSPKTDMTSYPYGHRPLREARTSVLAFGILIFGALRISFRSPPNLH